MATSVYVLQNDETLVAMQPSAFDAELDFQKLLSRFPSLLAGDLIDADRPRRFMLVRQEQAIGHELDPSRWSLDHLFLDQDGIPTLVEVKRQSDSRLRREVVGQMLDYASNCQGFWSTEQIQASFESTCAAAGLASESILSDLLGADRPAEDFWKDVSLNLKAGRIRMLFVADQIPTELRRIVEFLNEQMNPAEVLAVELRQFTSGNLRTIVPTIFGQTQAAAQQRSTVAARARWTEDRLLARFEEKLKPPAYAAVYSIYFWMKESGTPLRFGVGSVDGSVMFDFRIDGASVNPAYMTTYGQLWIYLSAILTKPIFSDENVRREMIQQFAKIDGTSLSEQKVNQDQSISLDTIAADPLGVEKVIDAMKWIVAKVNAKVI